MEYIKIFPIYKENDEIIRKTLIVAKKDIEYIVFVDKKIYIYLYSSTNAYKEIPENEEKYLERKRYFERIFGVEEQNEETKLVEFC